MKFREHRGGFQESMDTTVEVGTIEDLTAHIRKLLSPFQIKIDSSMLEIRQYGPVDVRNGWQTHIVKLEDYGVIGFLDGHF